MDEKERFEKAMIEGGFEAPVRGQHGGYLYAEDAKAWGAWQLAVAAERHDCEIAVWLVRQEATKPDATDEGVNGWLQEAEDRIRMRSNE